MKKIKTFSVGFGDMFYIADDNGNFTIIDCHLRDEDEDRIIEELRKEEKDKCVNRFISTHPDEDHLKGIDILFKELGIVNFYCVDNKVKKTDETDSFKYYCSLRDDDKTFNLFKDHTIKWMNKSGIGDAGNYIESARVNVLWPDINNFDFKTALESSNNDGDPNNISPIIRYDIENGASFMWFGDLETDFIEKIKDNVDWKQTDIIFPPHHSRKSGKLSKEILDILKPKIIVVGEANSEDLEYYNSYNTITQISAGDITFECNGDEVDIYCTKQYYSVPFLENNNRKSNENYLGTLLLKEKVLI